MPAKDTNVILGKADKSQIHMYRYDFTAVSAESGGTGLRRGYCELLSGVDDMARPETVFVH